LEDPLALSDAERVFQAQPRLSIIYLLFLKRRVGFTDLAHLLGLTPGNLDHHVRKLEEAGFVKTRKVISWKPLVAVEITREGAETFRGYVVKLRSMIAGIPDKMLKPNDD
jgi:DNA-binding MarR family transcriptional regulator